MNKNFAIISTYLNEYEIIIMSILTKLKKKTESGMSDIKRMYLT